MRDLLRFEWDESKNKINIEKHGVSFDEAKTVFSDYCAKIITDSEYLNNEERFLLLGFSNTLRLLIVCHCYKENENLIRIISARKATKTESSFYGN
jgi:uncharacterized DUF497 family protein